MFPKKSVPLSEFKHAPNLIHTRTAVGKAFFIHMQRLLASLLPELQIGTASKDHHPSTICFAAANP